MLRDLTVCWLQVAATALDADEKNYHAWAHRQAVVSVSAQLCTHPVATAPACLCSRNWTGMCLKSAVYRARVWLSVLILEAHPVASHNSLLLPPAWQLAKLVDKFSLCPLLPQPRSCICHQAY